MAFPQVASTTQTNGTTATSTPTANLPATVNAGDLLIVYFATSPGGTNPGYPAGWTRFINQQCNIGGGTKYSAGWRKADGTEGSGTVAVTNGGFSNKFAALVQRWTGAEDPTVQPPETSTAAQGNGTGPDPTTATPTGGAKDYAWVWAGAWEGEQTSPPASNPTNYASNKAGADSGTAGSTSTNRRVALATRELNAASEDPGAWTISAAGDFAVFAVAIHPTAGGAVDQEPALIEGKLVTNSVLLRHLVRTE